jgi:hypothetical protein
MVPVTKGIAVSLDGALLLDSLSGRHVPGTERPRQEGEAPPIPPHR